ncbi:helix-turn-helix transcriptional regulator [Sedimentibacter sp.]|uniref:helix-turn-helix domain-containing protein n=1 Tax=Sedimentibacter sp. TaxID=1960295 RepID=UPI000EC1EBAB|nr:helix-turn-helix transcriptional regulator [Sedimentibacter sp.]HCX62176.1 transcriptional regulator [Clostridiales bacterium]
MTFGQKLKLARKNKNYTQKNLADAIGAKHNSVSDWENDKNRPDPDTIELICNVLDVSANYLLGTKDPKDFLSPEAINIAQAYDKADFNKQNIVRLTLGFNLKLIENVAENPTEYNESDRTTIK